MIELKKRAAADASVAASVTLPIDKRIKCRLKVHLDDDREAGIFLNRGETLQHGDKLISEDGLVVLVQAALEQVSCARCADPLLFARACYHMGNRHVPLQIEVVGGAGCAGAITYLHDHVLDEMLQRLGLQVDITQAPFNPEPGAYGGGHQHGDAHHHGHAH